MSVALALPGDGKVVACDVSMEYPDIGRPYWKEAGVSHKIDLRIGPAADTLRKCSIMFNTKKKKKNSTQNKKKIVQIKTVVLYTHNEINFGQTEFR